MSDLVIVTLAELAIWLAATFLGGACIGAIVVLLILRHHDQAAAEADPATPRERTP